MGKIIYFDYCALILVCMLIITTISRRMTHGKQNRFFMYLMVVILITTVADIFSVTLDRMGSGHAAAKYIFHTIYLLAHIVSVPAYVAYLYALTDVWHQVYKHKGWLLAVLVPIISYTVLLLFINPFTHVIFYLDSSDTYTRGSWFVILYVISVFYSSLGFIHICKHRKQFTTVQFIAVSAMFPVLIAIAIVQFLFPNYLIEMFATISCLTFVSMMVQRPENFLDYETGLGKITAYITSLKNASATGKHIEIIMVNIVNYSILHEMLGYQGINRMLKNLAVRLTAFNKKQALDADLYYLGEGKYRLVLDAKRHNRTIDAARHICESLRQNFIFNQMTINVVANVCITKYPEDIDNSDSMIAFGNDLNSIPYSGEVMFASKIYKKQYYDIKKDIDWIMEDALARNKFEVYYQPIYSVAEERFNSAEALLRLNTEKYGFISPEVFIPAAEKSGAIHKIGSFVIEEVCKFISSDEYKELGIDYIEINLSVAQCMQNNLSSDILDTLNKYGVKPEQINLEITETAASYSQNTMMENLKKLGAAGVHFSLDDFGTGYSNMKRIASLPLNIVKLDKSFTNIEENPKLMIILENTIRMIKDMDMKIVVEGIETENMVKVFAELECEYIQGYFYSKPIPKNDFVEFILQS